MLLTKEGFKPSFVISILYTRIICMADNPITHTSADTVKTTTTFLGFVLLLLGLWGFAQDPIMGVFEVDTPHNLIHALLGIWGIVAGMTNRASAINFLRTGGIISLALAVLGVIAQNGNKILGLVENNSADNWLHLLIGGLMIYFAYTYMDNKQTNTNTAR